MLSLDVIVVGGGIAGIATAFTVQRAGHKVTVLESHPTPNKSRGPVTSPPNMTRILNQWGLHGLMDTKGTLCDRMTFRNGDDGAFIGLVKLHEQFLAELCAGYYFIQHGDLHDALTDLAVKQGVRFRYSAVVDSIVPAAGTVMLRNGEQLKADLIVGADGSASLVRETFNKHMDGPQEEAVNVTVAIPVADVVEDEIQDLKTDPFWHVWLGDGFTSHIRLIHSRQDIGITISLGVAGSPCAFHERWEEEDLSIDAPVCEKIVSRFEPRFQKLLRKAKRGWKTARPVRPVVDQFVDESGRCVLVGDAAHPSTVSGNQAVALGIEDAEVLGVLLSHLDRPGELRHILSAYEELRVPRAHEAQTWDLDKWRMMTLPYGEAQKARDARWRAAMALEEYDDLDEKTFYENWGEELQGYKYHATEAAEDWWTKWGPLLSNRSHRASTEVHVSHISEIYAESLPVN